jgi:hypothetical protein
MTSTGEQLERERERRTLGLGGVVAAMESRKAEFFSLVLTKLYYSRDKMNKEDNLFT